jgi:alpha-L-fucosidase
VQPWILINGRSGVEGDFSTPEQSIPNGTQKGMFEACVTITRHHWGYCPNDPVKDEALLLDELIACAAAGGNYLLNVGPDPDGVIPAAACERLRALGHWLQAHGEAIYGSQRLLPDWWDYTSFGRITARDTFAYLIIQDWSPGGVISFGQLKNQVLRATLLSTGQELQVRREGRRIIIAGLPVFPPSMPYNVVKLELDRPAEAQYYY